MDDKTLLIVGNAPSPNMQRLLDAAVEGAREAEPELNVVCKSITETHSADVLAADGYLLGTTENFGAMAGLFKDFLERIYYDCLDQTGGRPFALFVRAGLDGEGAKVSVERIITGLRWKAAQDTLVLQGDYEDQFEAQCRDLGMLMACGVASGVL